MKKIKWSSSIEPVNIDDAIGAWPVGDCATLGVGELRPATRVNPALGYQNKVNVWPATGFSDTRLS